MPLRDHFRKLRNPKSWGPIHGAWPTVMVMDLNRRLPPTHVAAPNVYLGSFEVDVAASAEHASATSPSAAAGGEQLGGGGVAAAVWAPPQPTLTTSTELLDQDVFEVRVHEDDPGRRLVAAVEIISPSNKDRPEHRRSFVAKCADLLSSGVSVTMVDVVTTRESNLYLELLQLLGRSDATA